MTTHEKLTHDIVVENLLAEYRIAEKKRYTDFFLFSLSDSKFNSGLYAFATMKTFPEHTFSEYPKEKGYTTFYCSICSGGKHDVAYRKDYENYFFVGGIHANDIYEKLYILQRINRLDSVPCVTEHDFDTFKEIISNLRNAKPDTKIKDIKKQLKQASFFKQLVNKIRADGIGKEAGATLTAEEKIRCILDTLGVCGILHTEKHKGSFYEYVNLELCPRSSRSSDWAYPVDFWRGKDGIDWEAMDYWFGEYKELESISTV